jgi:hypothetical protein
MFLIHEGHEGHEDVILEANVAAGIDAFSLRDLRALRGFGILDRHSRSIASPPHAVKVARRCSLGSRKVITKHLVPRWTWHVACGPARFRGEQQDAPLLDLRSIGRRTALFASRAKERTSVMKRSLRAALGALILALALVLAGCGGGTSGGGTSGGGTTGPGSGGIYGNGNPTTTP